MLENIPRFAMTKKVGRQHLRLLIWILSLPALIQHRNRLTKVGMEGIKPPYLLLCNHNSFMDFKVSSRAVFPNRANYVVAIDGFIKREWLLRLVGCICKRKFTTDTVIVRHLHRVIGTGDIAVIYPEARYSQCGTTAVLPESIGKLAKFLKVPVVTLICNGHHINSPVWNLSNRRVKGTTAEMTCIMTAEEIANTSQQEITEAIRKAFVYDDFKWQKDNNIRINYKQRAKGLHKVLYQCTECKTEYHMSSEGSTLRCKHCGKEWEMTELGELQAIDGKTKFSHIPDWYEWERQNVRKEILRGEYSFQCSALVRALPNAKKFIDIGYATLTHNYSGFSLEGDYSGNPYNIKISVPTIYSCHIEYDYLGKYGDCIDLNTTDNTLYIYPQNCEFSVTKIAIATEELHSLHLSKSAEELFHTPQTLL